jgi:hypothetical protein
MTRYAPSDLRALSSHPDRWGEDHFGAAMAVLSYAEHVHRGLIPAIHGLTPLDQACQALATAPEHPWHTRILLWVLRSVALEEPLA